MCYNRFDWHCDTMLSPMFGIGRGAGYNVVLLEYVMNISCSFCSDPMYHVGIAFQIQHIPSCSPGAPTPMRAYFLTNITECFNFGTHEDELVAWWVMMSLHLIDFAIWSTIHGMYSMVSWTIDIRRTRLMVLVLLLGSLYYFNSKKRVSLSPLMAGKVFNVFCQFFLVTNRRWLRIFSQFPERLYAFWTCRMGVQLEVLWGKTLSTPIRTTVDFWPNPQPEQMLIGSSLYQNGILRATVVENRIFAKTDELLCFWRRNLVPCKAFLNRTKPTRCIAR